MKTRTFIYAAVGALALVYLAVANSRGYVPFAATAAQAARGASSSHFHK
jgi:hypothetical protein